MLHKGQTNPTNQTIGQRGQALVEYALIVVLVVMALAAAVAATGPAIGNVFSNVVCNLIEQQQTCGTPVADLYNRGGPTAFWLTVTAVATNPPTPRGFPTDPPTPPKPTNTPGPSPTPSPTIPTPTPSNTPTLPPTPTPTDIGHDVPFSDPINQPVWWRVDSSVYLGGNGWRGEYYPSTDLSGTADAIMFNQQLDPVDTYTYDIAFDWGTGGPSGGSLSAPGIPWKVDSFSIRWTRNIYVAAAMTINVTIRGDDGYRFYLDDVLKTPTGAWSGQTFSSTPTVISLPLTAGNHVLKVEYRELSGNGPAGIFVEMTQYKANVNADSALPSGAANCQWTRLTGPQPNSITWTWKESSNPTSTGFPPSMRCNLELRGWVNLTSAPSQSLTFWDAWDLLAGTTIKLQLAEYVPYNADGSGGPNWTQYPTTTLHSGTTNYNWTRSTIPIPTGLVGKKMTYRFVMESGSGTGNRRWYLDDILVDTTNNGKTFDVCRVSKDTCGNAWNLNSPDQKGDFVTTGRWDLTSDIVATNDDGSQTGMAWAVSGLTNANNSNSNVYVPFGPEQPSGTGANNIRVHAVEFNGKLDLRAYNADGSGGASDWQGNDSSPQVTFSYAYDLGTNDGFELQYTFDALDTTPDTWTAVPATGITGYPVSPASSNQINTVMTQVSVPLTTIPGWNANPFRLRFALKVDSSSQRAGVWIDNIIIDRVGVPRFSNYPFCEDAEGGTGQWTLQGSWGTIGGGAFNSGRAYTDSPAGNYVHGQQTSMQLKYALDLNNDTPENFQNPNTGNKNCSGANSTAAIRPILSFFTWRRLAPNESFSVDIYRNASTKSGTLAIGPTAVWTYTYNSRTNYNLAWEHVEVELDAAVKQVTGLTLAQLKSSAYPDPRDDDFYIAFRLDTRSDTSVADGIYLDVINISEYTETAHKLWNTSVNVTPVTGAPAAGVGNGARYIDDIDNPSTWFTRWTNGGDWTRINWDPHSSTYSFTDSPPSGTTYRHDTFSVLEMTKIIDLRGAKMDDTPIMYFWDHYNIGDSDYARVQIAVQDQYEMTGTPPPPSVLTPTKRNRQGYDYLYDWGSDTSYGVSSSWQNVWSRGPYARVDTWGREQIDLSPYADNPATPLVNEGKRIKIRFVLDALDVASGLRDGWFIDDIRIELRSPLIHSLPFIDHAQNMSNWIGEGKWGLAPDYFRGSGGDTAVLGPNKWNAYFFDCIQWMATWTQSGHATPTASDLTQVACDANSTNTFLNGIGRTVAATNTWRTARPQYPILTEAVDNVDYNFGTTGRPFGAPLDASGGTWDDYYMGRWMRDISVIDGDFTFITTSDDGVRLKYETNPAGGAPSGWNIINNWTTHSTQINIKTIHLAAGNYQLILEWFESTSTAVIKAQIGNDFFSFSDSPKAGAGSTYPSVPSVAYGNSSLMLDGVIPLTSPGGIFVPRLQYFVYYELGASATARAEVSIDGGFTWVQSNLNQNCPNGVPAAYCDPTTYGTSSLLPENGYDWAARSHDLRSYVNRDIIIRFRLNTTSDVRDGWWITDIEVR